MAPDGQLALAWRELFTKYADRFVVGSDTWVNQRWDSYAETMAQYRAWLGQLPEPIATKIAHENGLRIFQIQLTQ